MCMMCMRCGKCEGVEPPEEVKAFKDAPKKCLKCKTLIPRDATTCPGCGRHVNVPPGVSSK